MNVPDPGNSRGYIDGQLFGVAYQVGNSPPAVGAIGNPSQILSFLVFDGYQIPAEPTWIGDVAPIFQQYANLYPIMKRVVDLSNFGSVVRDAAIIKNVFNVPESSPNYMPVTRDLSIAKRNMLLAWLDRPTYMSLNSVDQLKQVLQTAIMLEHATIPVYMTALWSIKEGRNTEVRNIIASVLAEEMLHMSLVSNILMAIGGAPQIGQPGFVPTFPGSLPGGLRADLVVSLKKVSIEHIRDVFLEIEMPAEMVEQRRRRLAKRGANLLHANYTIGWFYSQIGSALENLATSGDITFGNLDKQVTEYSGPGNLYLISNLTMAQAALREISEQGEGCKGGLYPRDEQGELAHYYKFAEIVQGRRLQKAANGTDADYEYTGPRIPFDQEGVWNMIDNPSLVHYLPGTRAYVLAREVAETYQTLLNALHETYNGNPGKLRDSVPVAIMYGLCRQGHGGAQLLATPSLAELEPGTTAGPQFNVDWFAK